MHAFRQLNDDDPQNYREMLSLLKTLAQQKNDEEAEPERSCRAPSPPPRRLRSLSDDITAPSRWRSEALRQHLIAWTRHSWDENYDKYPGRA